MPKIQLDKLKDIKLDRTKRETLMLIAVPFILFIFLYFQFFLKAAIIEIFSLLPKVRALKIDIKKTKEDLNFEEILKKRLKNMEDAIKNYEVKLPAEEEIPMLLSELSSMAKDSYVKILGIKPVRSDPKKGEKSGKVYKEIPIMISSRSGYHELGAFINKLENASRFMEVSDISIKYNRSNFKRHDVELIVSTYVLLKE